MTFTQLFLYFYNLTLDVTKWEAKQPTHVVLATPTKVIGEYHFPLMFYSEYIERVMEVAKKVGQHIFVWESIEAGNMYVCLKSTAIMDIQYNEVIQT